MNFAGWTLQELAPLFGAVAGGITLLYLLKMRRRQMVVTFAALWEQISKETETRKLWRRLRRLLSWLLQIFLLATICLALGDPRPQSWFREPRTLAIVIDVSSSMAADSTEEGMSRLDAAIARARSEIEALGPADRAVIIAAGSEVTVPSPLGGEPTALLESLERIEITAGEADMTRALGLARNVLGGTESPRVLILTDGALEDTGVRAVERCLEREQPACELIELKGPTDNVAITAFAARRYPGDREKVEVLAEVQNLGENATRVVLDVTADGLSIGRRTVALGPGEKRREVLPALDAARDRLVARLEPHPEDPGSQKALGPDEDDRAWAVVPPLEPLEVVLVSDGTNLFLEAALLTLDDHVRLTGLPADGGAADVPEMDDADVVIYDIGAGKLPDPLPEKNLVLFDPHRHEDSPSPIDKARDLVRPRLTEQKRKHPILAGVVFKDVNMHRGTSFDLAPGDQALVSHLGEPIMVLREAALATLVIGFDPRQSDLPLRVAFPLLVANTIDFFAEREAGFVAAVPIGRSRELSLVDLGLGGGDVNFVEVVEPGQEFGTKQRVQGGRFRMRALVPGIHTIRALDGDAEGAEVEIAVNQANVAASSLTSKLDEITDGRASADAPEPAPLEEGPLWTLLLLAVLGLVTLEWATYHRRKTV